MKTYPRHREFNIEIGERTDTDRRIGEKINYIKQMYNNHAKFLEWYVTTPFGDDVLEKMLDEKIAEFNAEEFAALDILVGYVPPNPLECVEDWAADLGESPTELRSLYGYG